MNKNTYTCKICGKEFISANAGLLKKHIDKEHSLEWLSYLREYHPELGTGYCTICGKETKLDSFEKGFKLCCGHSCIMKYISNTMSQERKDSIKEKRNLTNTKKYGGNSPLCSKSVRGKSKQTCLEKYGVDNISKVDAINEKKKETTLNNYGVENPFQAEKVKEIIKQTCLEKYGVRNAAQADCCKDKTKKTNLERYGVEHVLQHDEVRIKIKKTYRENYFDTFIKLLSYTNIKLLDTKEEYINNDVHRYSCKEHGEFESEGTQPQTVCCPLCVVQPKSNLEKQIVDFLSGYVNLETSNRKILSGKELDIFIPSHNLAIEFDGLYWHSNNNHDKNYHLDKTLNCEQQNIQLIHIFENEWIHKRPIVESILLAKLGIFQKRIYGRRCEVKIVSHEAYREFVELNHLQGYVRSPLVLGLYYQDELVEICSFGKSRFKTGELELLRYCSLLNTQIIGGFSKLINAWKKLNPEQELFTYCDRRYSTGKSYEASGWEHIGTSAPNYFYIRGTKLENRIKYQKHKLSGILETFDETLSEQENMSINGYNWIYDCGNLKYKI
jgi:hypothetical protein